MRWRGAYHCERCGQPTARERLTDAARTVLLYTRHLDTASSDGERARWALALERTERALRDELDRLARARAALLAPLKRAESADRAEWKPTPLESAPPPPEFHALAEALRGRRRITPPASAAASAPASAALNDPPPAARALLELSRAW